MSNKNKQNADTSPKQNNPKNTSEKNQRQARFASLVNAEGKTISYNYINNIDYVFPKQLKFDVEARKLFDMFSLREAIVKIDKATFYKLCSLNKNFALSIAFTMYVATTDTVFVDAIQAMKGETSLELPDFEYYIPMDVFMKCSATDRRPSEDEIAQAKQKGLTPRGGYLTENNLVDLYKLIEASYTWAQVDCLFTDYVKYQPLNRETVLSAYYPNGIPEIVMNPVTGARKSKSSKDELIEKYIAKDDNNYFTLGDVIDALGKTR